MEVQQRSVAVKGASLKSRKKEISNEHIKVEDKAWKRASNIQKKLNPKPKTFISKMRRVNVTKSFCLNIPITFCKKYLPNTDTVIVLVDENEEKFNTIFCAAEGKLKIGWKNFATSKKLSVGDHLVFHLIEANKFKVYIVRLYDNESGNQQGKNTPCVADFKNYKIIVGGIKVNSMLPKEIKTAYFSLCCSQRSLLHAGVTQCDTSENAASIIIETVHLSNAIKTSNISTPIEDIINLHETLNSLEVAGMKLGFMRIRLKKLFNLVKESHKDIDWNRDRDAENEGKNVDEHIKDIEENIKKWQEEIRKLRNVKRKIDCEREEIRRKAKSYEVMYETMANASW